MIQLRQKRARSRLSLPIDQSESGLDRISQGTVPDFSRPGLGCYSRDRQQETDVEKFKNLTVMVVRQFL